MYLVQYMYIPVYYLVNDLQMVQLRYLAGNERCCRDLSDPMTEYGGAALDDEDEDGLFRTCTSTSVDPYQVLYS